jgi:uncharacterized protein (DUF1330 family)
MDYDVLEVSEEARTMAAYLFAQITVTDPEQYERYKAAVPAVIKQYGGKYLIRGGQVEVLEGVYDGKRLVVLEFPTVEQARAFWHSPEYAKVKELRLPAATMNAWVVEGM